MDLSEFSFASECKGKVCVIVAVPSLDTSVCNMEARRFDREAAATRRATSKVIVISEDLPFAQKRWGDDAGVNNYTDSQRPSRYARSARSTGADKGHEAPGARRVYVVDKQGKVRYRELVKEQGNEPDYDKASAKSRGS